MLCRRSYAAAKTQYVDRFFLVNPSTEIDTITDIVNAIGAFEPDIVIPSAENTVMALYDIWQLHVQGRLPNVGEKTMEIVRRSIPDPAKHHLFYNKIDLLNALDEMGVRIPPQRELHSFGDADRFIQEHGYPVILKPNKGQAGIGIAICRNEEELIAGLRERLRPGSRERWAIQRLVDGRPANYPFVARDGLLTAGMSLDRLVVHPAPMGPSTVMRMVQNDEMESSATSFARLLGYNGFGSAQFMVEGDGEGPAYFIETNFRIGVTTHLGYLLGPDLCSALVQTWKEQPIDLQPPNNGVVVALYPQEAFRDPKSEYLKGVVDWVTEDPALAEHFAQQIEAKWGNAPVAR